MNELAVQSLLSLAAAAAAGGVIGIERAYHGRPAGFRTHILVCMASALLMLLMQFQWQAVPADQLSTIRVDPTRMAQGIMTGIGFLGAGAILHDRHSIRGLTTAASIWITAAIGIIFGSGFFVMGAISSLMTLLVLSAFRVIEERLPSNHYARLSIVLRENGETSANQRDRQEEIFTKVKELKLGYEISAFRSLPGEHKSHLQLVLNSFNSQRFIDLNLALSNLPYVLELNLKPLDN